MDIEEDKDYLQIAYEGLKCALPPEWSAAQN